MIRTLQKVHGPKAGKNVKFKSCKKTLLEMLSNMNVQSMQNDNRTPWRKQHRITLQTPYQEAVKLSTFTLVFTKRLINTITKLNNGTTKAQELKARL